MKQLFSLFFITLLLMIAGSCQKKLEPKQLKQLRLNIRGEPATLDPRKGADVISSELHILLFEGLTRLNSDGSIALAQAEAIDISPDQCVYTFHLRESKWSDGTPVTSLDFERSWKNIIDPHFPAVNAPLFYPIKNAEAARKGKLPLSEVGIDATDPRTLIITLERPTPYFLNLTSFCLFAPVSHLIDEKDPSWAYQAGKHFISNGPYILRDWKHNDEILLAKNPYYWEKDLLNPDLIHFSMVDDQMTAFQMFEHGELDILGDPLCAIPVDAMLELKAEGKLTIKPMAGTTIIAFNTQCFPFTNLKMRQAFSYAINREQIVKHITQFNEQVALNAIPPALKSSPTFPLFSDCDLENARTLFALGLKELGIQQDDLKEITYHYSASDVNHKIAYEIQQQWQQTFGIKVRLENTDRKILMEKLIKRDFTAAQSTWIAQYQDPINIFERFKFQDNPKNYPGWEHPKYIDLLEQSSYETGDQRMAILDKAEALLLEEMPIAPIYHWNSAFVIQPYLKNVAFSPTGKIDFTTVDIDLTQKDAFLTTIKSGL